MYVIDGDVITEYKGSGKEVVIPDTVKGIGANAFNGCEELESVTIPANVTTIDITAFADCLNLKVIKGYKNTYAEIFAKEHGYEFVDLSEETPSQPVKDKEFYDVDGREGIHLSDAQQILKFALGIDECELEYKLADAQMCLKYALGIETIE